MPVFTTANLRIRKLVEADFDAFHEMQSDDEVMRYTNEDGHGLSEEINREQLAGCISAYDVPDNDFWVWAIINSTGEFVGTCAVVKNEKAEREIGYRFLQKCWGKGYGSEVVNPLIDFVSRNLGIARLVAYVDVRNLASVKILDRSKMSFLQEIRTGKITDRKYVYTYSE